MDEFGKDYWEQRYQRARERVATRDAEAARRIHSLTADLTTWTRGADRFDLVSSASVHVPGDRSWRSVAPVLDPDTVSGDGMDRPC